MINPALRVRRGEDWVGIYELLRLDDLAARRFEEVVSPEVIALYRQKGQDAQLLRPHPRHVLEVDGFRQIVRRQLQGGAVAGG